MDSLFGLPMNALLIAMVALLAFSLSTIAYIALRNRIMFLIGLRNIPRRVAQTVLIIVGLMLSTLIVSAAFTTGDTVDHSITKDIYRLYGHVDEIVEFKSREDAPSADIGIPADDFASLEQALRGDPNIDGLLPVIVEEVPVIEPTQRQSAPNARFVGLDETRLGAFPDVVDLNGNLLDVAALAEDEVYINESLADELDTTAGAEIKVYYENEPIVLRVAAVAEGRAITGSFGGGETEGLVTRLSTIQRLFNKPDEIQFIAVSNTGGLRDGIEVTDAVEARLEAAFVANNLQLNIADSKRDNLDLAELAGNGMMTFFLIFGTFSIAAGILLVVMIFVMLAAERKSELGMARALGTKRWHLVEMFVSEGMGYNVVSALVGATLGVLVAFGFTLILAAVFAGADFEFTVEPAVSPRSFIIAYSLGVVLTFITVTFSSWQASRLNIVRAIRDLPEPPAKPGWRSLAVGLALAPPAALLMWWGYASDVAFFFGLGFSLACLAAAILSRLVRLPARPTFSAIGLALLIFWALFAGGRVPGVGELTGGPEMFILSGIVMVASASYVLVYNADIMLAGLSFAGQGFGRVLPALRMAIAYPLASKFRTGMTLAMIAIVVFALTMMSVMNSNFDRLFLSEKNFGGWDVEVRENASNPLEGGLAGALEQGETPVDTSEFAATGSIAVAPPFRAELCQPNVSNCDDLEEFEVYILKGADEAFFRHATIPLQARATGYETDAAVWGAVAGEPSKAVIDVNALGSDFLSFGDFGVFGLQGLDADVRSFDPIDLVVRDAASGAEETVEVIGIMELGASGGGDPGSSFFGLMSTSGLVERVFGEPDFTNHYVALDDSSRAEVVAREIESALLTTGVQASSMRKDREEESALFNSFFYLMQSFAGLGLVVGVAAVGVVAFRSVVERRQQIGMLRAIGFTRGAVALSFAIESTFIALLGVLSGVGLAILLATSLLTSEEFSATGIQGVYIPWLQIIAIAAFALGATLLMTLIPARQAASVPIAEALRYE